MQGVTKAILETCFREWCRVHGLKETPKFKPGVDRHNTYSLHENEGGGTGWSVVRWYNTSNSYTKLYDYMPNGVLADCLNFSIRSVQESHEHDKTHK